MLFISLEEEETTGMLMVGVTGREREVPFVSERKRLEEDFALFFLFLKHKLNWVLITSWRSVSGIA